MKLKCQKCKIAKNVPDVPVGGVPVLDWWDSVGKLCSRCRNTNLVDIPEFIKIFNATIVEEK